MSSGKVVRERNEVVGDLSLLVTRLGVYMVVSQGRAKRFMHTSQVYYTSGVLG